MRHLDRLNTILAAQAIPLGLPTFRTKVGDNMSNLHWLRKHVGPVLNTSQDHTELRTLLTKTEKELLSLRPGSYSEPAAADAQTSGV